MKDKLYGLIYKENGNCVAILCNIDDAIQLQISYESRAGVDSFEIVGLSKYGAVQELNKAWFINNEKH